MNFDNICESAKYILSRTHIIPQIAIVLGSGLGDFAERLEEQIEIPYKDIPHFPVSTVTGHFGRFIFGKLGEKYVIAMQGRVHYYEGYTMNEIAFPVWVLRQMGVGNIIMTNAAGAINEEYSTGDFVTVVDHIKLTAESPLRGVTINELGPRFVDMTKAYSENLIEIAKEVAYGIGLNMHEGVYAFMGGPQYETPAEIRMLSVMGADLVGMSTVPEVIAAAQCGMNALVISCVTNFAAGINPENALDHSEVLKNGIETSENFAMLISGIIDRIKVNAD